MPASYAGVDLLLGDPGGQLQDWLDRNLPIGDASLFCADPLGSLVRWNGRRSQGPNGGIETPKWPACPRWALNSLWWPTGASRFAIGLFLTDTTGLAKILGKLESSGGSAKLKLSDGRVNLETSMYLLPPRPLSAQEFGNSFFLLPLVDERYLWRWKQTDTSFVFDESATWSDVISAIGMEIGTVSFEAIHASYVRPDPHELSRRAENAAVLLDAVAESIGQRFVRQLDGTLECRTWDVFTTTLNRNERGKKLLPLAGHALEKGVPGIRPAEVLVVFRKAKGSVPYADGDVHVVTESGAQYVSGSTVVGGKVFYTTALADFSSEGGSPDNAAAVNALASKIAADYYASLERPYDRSYGGLAEWTLTGFDDFIWWRLGSQDGPNPGEYAAYTRVCSPAYDFSAGELLHQFDDIQPTPVGTFFVRLNAGETLDAGGTAEGQPLVWNGSAYAVTGQTVTVYDPLGNAAAVEGDDLVCVLDSSNRVTVLSSSGGVRFSQYELQEDWGATTADQATCDRLDLFTGTLAEEDVVVYSRPEGMFDALEQGDKLLGFKQDGKHYAVAAPC